MVAAIIEEKKDGIAAMCREYGVKRLDVFGSATTDRFHPETSDIDRTMSGTESFMVMTPLMTRLSQR